MDMFDSSDLIEHMEKLSKDEIDVMRKKNHDYSGEKGTPFSNFLAGEILGVGTVEQGFMFRILDKIMRIITYMNDGELKVEDEGVSDAFKDLRNYFGLLHAWESLDEEEKMKAFMSTANKLEEIKDLVESDTGESIFKEDFVESEPIFKEEYSPFKV